MTDLTLDVNAGTLRPLNGMHPTLELTDEDLALAAMAPEDHRYATGQWLQSIGPQAGSKIREEGPLQVKVLGRYRNGYRVTAVRGDVTKLPSGDGFIHDHAAHGQPTPQWRPIQEPACP